MSDKAIVSNRRESDTCPHCKQNAIRAVSKPYTTEVQQDGRTYTVVLPFVNVFQCAHCGDEFLGNEANGLVRQRLREQLALLSPQQIREERLRAGLSQK